MQKMYVDKIRAGAWCRREIRSALDQLEMSGRVEYREVKGFLDSTFVVKADAKTWNLLIEAINAWKDHS